MCSCTSEEKNDNPFYQYILRINVQDASGNDLVKGIGWDWWQSDVVPEEEATAGGVNRELYSLEVIYPEPCMDTYLLHYSAGGIMDDLFPTLGIFKKDDNYYLVFDEFSYNGGGCPAAEKLTFKLTCPYIFGDKEVHEIVTYWKPDPKWDGIKLLRFFCTHIEVDGKAFTQIEHLDAQPISVATVVLEK